MFLKESIAIDIDDDFIKVMKGNRKSITKYAFIKTPKDSVQDGKIIDIEIVVKTIEDLMKEKNIKGKDVSFALHGHDIVTRHIEVPIMKEKNLRDAVDMETGQFLPDNGSDYYIDFQILEKIENEDKKTYKLLVAAAPKEKVDRYAELAEKLKLQLKAIDVSANCISRIFKESKNLKDIGENIGIIDIGEKKSSIIILNKGNLFMEREVPFGIDNVVREISKKKGTNEEKSLEYLKNVFDFTKIDEESELETRIQTLFENVFSSFVKVIQFYAAGKVNKTLDQIYIMGLGCELQGIEEYVHNYFTSPTLILNSNKKLPIDIRINGKCSLRYYIDTIGLLLRKE